MMLSQLSPSADHPHTDPGGKVKGDVGEWVAPKGLARPEEGGEHGWNSGYTWGVGGTGTEGIKWMRLEEMWPGLAMYRPH